LQQKTRPALDAKAQTAMQNKAPTHPTPRHPPPKIIGLCGSAGSGKDTAFTLLRLQLRTAGLAFADPMRGMIEALFQWAGVPRRYMQNRKYKEAVIPQLGVSYRRLAQTLGTEWGRHHFGEDFWTRIADAKLEKLRRGGWEAIAITDVRTAQEAAWVRKQGGLIWHIHRPQVTPVLDHITEAMPFLADRTVMNDRGIAELSVEIRSALECFDADLMMRNGGAEL
jgi:hypothetical protein